MAKENGTMVILDVGGRDELLSKDLLNYVDIISPNEVYLIDKFFILLDWDWKSDPQEG